MIRGVLFRRVLMVLGGMQMMPERHLGVVRRLFVVARLVMLCGFAMVLGRVLMVFRGLFVVIVDAVTVHRSLPGGGFPRRVGAWPGSMKHLRRFGSGFPSRRGASKARLERRGRCADVPGGP